jgi:hypothetical protein
MILETPKDTPDADQKNLLRVRKIFLEAMPARR